MADDPLPSDEGDNCNADYAAQPAELAQKAKQK